MSPEEFKQELLKHHISLSDLEMSQFADYFQLLVAYNQKVNLTTITEEKEVYLKHFFDSIAPAFYLPSLLEDKSIVDVGSGAGFPSIPLKIINPKLKVTIVDSLQKRLKFLEQLINHLGLSDVKLVHQRAEDFGQDKKYREHFDFATARALAALNVLVELCLPDVKVGGRLIALKGAKADLELQEASVAIAQLGGEVENDFKFTLPDSDEIRHIIVIKKVKATKAKYPRRAGIPNKNPIR